MRPPKAVAKRSAEHAPACGGARDRSGYRRARQRPEIRADSPVAKRRAQIVIAKPATPITAGRDGSGCARRKPRGGDRGRGRGTSLWDRPRGGRCTARRPREGHRAGGTPLRHARCRRGCALRRQRSTTPGGKHRRPAAGQATAPAGAGGRRVARAARTRGRPGGGLRTHGRKKGDRRSGRPSWEGGRVG